MKLVCKEPTNPAEWVFIYLITGPVLGALLFMFWLLVISGRINLIVFLVLLLSALYFAVPAAMTGYLMYRQRNRINNLLHLLCFAMMGAVVTALWSLLVLRMMHLHGYVVLILALIGWLSTFLIALMFFQKKAAELPKIIDRH